MMDTIVALATPLGRSGIGMVRVSGGDALRLAGVLADDSNFRPEPRRAYLRQILDPENGETIDEAVFTFFQNPNSFTGEDIVEVSCHGSPVVLRRVIDICLASGARMAEPGEFSLRALANGRMNLAEAEAIRDLIDAQTTASARQAVRQLRGEFSHQLQPIKDELLDVIVILESALEFVEDDLPATQAETIKDRLLGLADSIAAISSTFRAGRLLREGLKVALVGRPNVGKSSLFNALLGSDRAIVTEIAGTTRDQLHERFTIHDIPISLLDTAGLRETTDTIESIGVGRSRKAMADADLVLIMLDASEHLQPEDREILESAKDLRHLIVFNKIDLARNESMLSNADILTEFGGSSVAISAKTGEGLNELRQSIVEPFEPNETEAAGFLVSDARHYDLLRRAEDEIRSSVVLLDSKTSEEIVLVGLHNSLRFLGEITGETTTEDMLTRIFSTFCIGK